MVECVGLDWGEPPVMVLDGGGEVFFCAEERICQGESEGEASGDESGE